MHHVVALSAGRRRLDHALGGEVLELVHALLCAIHGLSEAGDHISILRLERLQLVILLALHVHVHLELAELANLGCARITLGLRRLHLAGDFQAELATIYGILS